MKERTEPQKEYRMRNIFLCKPVLFLIGLLLVIFTHATVDETTVLLSLAAISLSALTIAVSAFAEWMILIPLIIFAGTALKYPVFNLFSPMLVFDYVISEYRSACRFNWRLALCSFLLLLPLFWGAGAKPLIAFLNLCLILLSAFLAAAVSENESMKTRYQALADEERNNNYQLRNKNTELQRTRDDEVLLSALNERNRIAREIHDNVGHLLTGALYQASALEIMLERTRSEEKQMAAIRNLKSTLNEAMSNISSSVHNLYDGSVEIKKVFEKMAEQYLFCPVCLNITDAELPADVRDCFIKTAREALSNTARHSNASRVNIKIAEYPGFFQMVISDNGRSSFSDSVKYDMAKGGMGLKSIADRVAGLGGTVNVFKEKGFKIFVSVPRAETNSRMTAG